MKKLFCLLLTIIFLFLSTVPAYANDSYNLVYIMASSTATQTTDILELIEFYGEIYIESEKASVLSDTEITEISNDKISFKDGYFRVDYTDKIIVHNNKFYCKLKELMDILRTEYEYLNKSKTLFFKHCTAFQENLFTLCHEIVAEDKPRNFDINFLDNIFGIGLATVYNVLKGVRIDYFWGGYQREQYEKAFANIMKGPDSDSEFLKLVSEGSSIMSDFSTLLELGESQGVYELFGLPYDEFIDIYNVYNKAIPGTSVSDVAEIAQTVYNSKNAYETFVNAVYYGIIKDGADGIVGEAANHIYNYYRGEAPTILNVHQKMIQNRTTDKITDIAKKSIGLNSIYVKTAGLIIDSLLGMDDKTSATEQAEICAEIQTIAVNSFLNGCSSYGKRYYDSKNVTAETLNEAILQIKYSTILYLRACQYTYSKFEFDKELKSIAEFMNKETFKVIQNVAAFSDEDLCKVVDNDCLDVSLCSKSYTEFWKVIYKTILRDFDNGTFGNFFNDSIIPTLFDYNGDDCPELFLFGAYGAKLYTDRVMMFYLTADGTKKTSCNNIVADSGGYANLNKYYSTHTKETIFLMGGGQIDTDYVKERGLTISQILFNNNDLSFITIADNNGLYYCNAGQPDIYKYMDEICSDFSDYTRKISSYYYELNPMTFNFAQTQSPYSAFDLNITEKEIENLFDMYQTNSKQSLAPSNAQREDITKTSTDNSNSTKVPPTSPITESNGDGLIQLTNNNARKYLENAIRCYTVCSVNNWYGIEYDETKPGVYCQNTDNPNYSSIVTYIENESGEWVEVYITNDYLVTNYNSQNDINAYINKYLTDGMEDFPKDCLNELFKLGIYYEYNGKLYYCPHIPNDKGMPGYDLSSIEVIEKKTNTEYMIAIDRYSSAGFYDCTDRMLVKNINGTFKISMVIDGEYGDRYYKSYISSDYQPRDTDLIF